MPVLRRVRALDDGRSGVVAPLAVVCDEVGTLLDPHRVEPPASRPGVVDALRRCRRAGLRIAVIGDLATRPVAAEDRRRLVATVLGPIDALVAPEPGELTDAPASEARPELFVRLGRLLDVDPASCVMIGGRRHLLAAADGAGALCIMVPNDDTPPFQLRGVRWVAPDLASAVEHVLAWRHRSEVPA